MNPHLPVERISKWIMGERTLEEERHVRECTACRAEVDRMAGALAEFRGAMYQWTGEPPEARHPRAARYQPRWALAALLLIAALWPIYRNATQRRRAEVAREDALLLQQVDAGVSRSIAPPMEPLAQLMAWENNRNSEKMR
jgi:hypothetical protein